MHVSPGFYIALTVFQIFKHSNICKMALSSTNQTTPNHDGYPLVFHALNFSLKLHNIIDNDEKHKRTKTRPLMSAQSSLGSKLFVRFQLLSLDTDMSKLCLETWVPGRAQLESVV